MYPKHLKFVTQTTLGNIQIFIFRFIHCILLEKMESVYSFLTLVYSTNITWDLDQKISMGVFTSLKT